MTKVIIDCAVFTYDQGSLKVLLTKDEICVGGKWGILSGNLNGREDTVDAAQRILKRNGVEKNLLLREFRSFIETGHDTDTLTVTVAFYAVINIEDYKVNLGQVNLHRRWSKVQDITDLVFSHIKILDFALYQLSIAMRESPIGFYILPKQFTLSELTNLYEQILRVKMEESFLCKKIVQKRVIIPLSERKDRSTLKLYKFNASMYEKLTSQNFAFNF